MIYNITPVPKPRMTHADKWKKRPGVLRYWAFKDEIRLKKVVLPETFCTIIFYIPMPKSWSVTKKTYYAGSPHKQKPDLDNLTKALWDAILDDDKKIWTFQATKLWAYEGAIEIN